MILQALTETQFGWSLCPCPKAKSRYTEDMQIQAYTNIGDSPEMKDNGHNKTYRKEDLHEKN